ncbi:MAG: hypothetical protein IT328_07925 [Caldilineaceae bacterium]|nr:hypothetical protein [Caldilineaceae bacterium]
MSYLSHKLSAAMWARVLILWLTLAIAALLVGGIAVGMGMFIRSNIHQELTSQQISFPAAADLSEHEAAIPGMLDYAGLPLSTGNQAKAYSEYIGLHMSESADEAGYPGAAYATLGGPQRELRAEVAAAKEANNEEALAEAQAKLDTVTALRNTMLTGSNLRGNLLSAYGWDNVGVGVIAAGGVIGLLALVFFLLFLFERRRGHLPPNQVV